MSRKRKAQTTMVLIVLIIIIFAGVVVFLLGLAKTITRVEYENMYVHNLLLTTLRTDTGSLDSNCKLVSDLLSCAFFEQKWVCAKLNNMYCLDAANKTISKYMEEFELVRKNYKYLFLVESLEAFPVLTETGELLKIAIGDQELAEPGKEKLAASERIQKGGRLLKVKLLIARR